MRIYRKEGDEVQLIAFPDEQVHKADYFLIEDPSVSRGLLVQVIDLQYANVPGVLEDILRDVMTDGELDGKDVDPLNISSEVDALKDTRLAVCKVRGTIDQDGSLTLVAAQAAHSAAAHTTDLALSRNSQFLYALDGGTMTISAFHVTADGHLMRLDSAAVPSGAAGLASR